ncbi:ATP-binding cassette domain-containing protein [Kyrpidia spormannii]|uniref:Uncharacterized protein n=2 Tax=Kyrpidia spormannii TaxID=2055160 RepID=A0ACA8Z704_9BACL|nr:ATP-binding cassette domain-containing protein [Kyrpidia spormannii]CAB3390700.1 protein of unknown function [Kyrpidia spormannii]CAB3391614.1 protein of unknown function [Kyrpidia spormannii]
MSVAIQTDRLTKLYGPGSGCRGITLSVKSGQIFGFLGPNGAGKSTFVKMLVGLIRPDAGRAEILGLPLGHREIRRQIGYREQAGWINALLVEQGITVYASGPVQTHLEQWFLALAEGEGGEIRGSRDAADLARDPA